MEIVTGSTGQVHVTSVDDAVRNGNVGYLNRNVVFTYLRNFEYLIVSNNSVRIYSGYGMMKGRLFKIDGGEFDDVVITNGAQGYKRADLIVAHYHMASQTGFESIELQVIRGNPGDSYVNPSYSNGDVNAGEDCDFPLYRVRLNGTTIEGVDRLFTLVADGGRLASLETTEAKIKASNLRTNLGSTSTAAMYNSSSNDVRPGVQGTLGVANGGTGQTTLKNAANSFAGALDANNSTPNPNDCYIGTTSGATGYQRKTLESLWAWLSTKIADRGYGDMLKKTFCGSDSGTVIQPSNGGTGQQSLQATRNAMGLGNTTGALPVANGGTGITATPSLLVNLASESATNIYQANPKAGVQGTLPISHGGTGATTAAGARNAMGLGNTTGAVPVANGGTGATSAANARTNLGVPPTNHASTATTYGAGNKDNYGHVKLYDGYTASGGSASAGVAASSYAVNELYKYAAQQDNTLMNGLNTLTNTVSGKAPTNHASTAKTYGAGNKDQYGHVKLYDGYTASGGSASAGVAASSYAVNELYKYATQQDNTLMNTFNNFMPKSGGTFTGLVTVERNSEGLLVLGNETQVTNPNNKGSAGKLRIYNSGIYRANLVASEEMTDNRTIILPKFGGTLALAEQTVPKSGGTFTGAVTIDHHSESLLVLGNEIQVANPNNQGSYGRLRIYNSYTYRANVTANDDMTDHRTIILPKNNGTLALVSSSSRRVKENIKDMSEERAKKILDIDVVNFDYIGDFGGGLKDQSGVIAEDTLGIIPEAVEISKRYDETKPIDEISNPAPSVDYSKFVPYLIKMVQMQQKEIEELKAALNK